MRFLPLAVAASLVLVSIPATGAHAWCQSVSARICATDADCLEGQACAARICEWRVPRTECERPDMDATFPLAWRHRCTSISVSGAAPSRSLARPDVLAVVGRSIATWEAARCEAERAPGIDVTLVEAPDECVRATHTPAGGNAHSVIFVQDGWHTERLHDERAFAVTLVWHGIDGEILDADIELNEEQHTFAVCDDLEGCASEVDLENTLTHELGHYFGLGHTFADPLATMHRDAPVGEIDKRSLAPDDVEGLCAIYPAGALPEACDPAPLHGLDLDCRPPSSCACRAPGAARSSGALALLMTAALVLVLRARRA